jgi:aryl-alcohol dehydrogenase-like predicted oxidoreductase
MRSRSLGPFEVSAVGLGCMNLSHAYGTPPAPEDGARLLLQALDLGYTLFDTAALYGFGVNEALVGQTLAARRDEFVLASKCGMFRNAEGVREINGRPEVLRKTCEDSLRRLRTEVIDLYYLHRWDRRVPIEDSVGALSDLVAEGKVRTIGLSEVSAETLRKAYAVHPITALQNEYSLWTRNPEIKVIEVCRELGVTLVAFSPLGRGFLAGTLPAEPVFEAKDIRRNMPRFEPDNYAANRELLGGFAELAQAAECSMAQLALAWVLARGDDVIPIPGTTSPEHLAENAGADAVRLDAATLAAMDELINQETVHGARYNANTQREIDSEEFAA